MLLLSSVAPLSPILLDDKSSVVRFFHTWFLLSAVAPLLGVLDEALAESLKQFWDFEVLGFWGFGVLGFWGFRVLGF